MTMSKSVSACLAVIACLWAGSGWSQEYPSKPIRVVIPVGAGSGLDIVARIATDRLARNLGVAIINDNIAGAGTTIGAAAVARAAPDGYTLIFWSEAAPLVALSYAKLPFDVLKDFVPVGTVAKGVFYLAVNPSLPVANVAELVALAKSKPGSIAYGTSGVGSPHHIVTEMFATAAGIKLLHVPFKGSGETVTSLLRGDIQMAMGLPSSFSPHLRSGKFRGLAVTASERTKEFPDLPTVTETGIKGVEYLSWYALFAPAATPQPIIAKLHAEIGKVVADRTYLEERLGQIGLQPFPLDSLAETTALSKKYYEMLAPIVRAAGIEPK